MPVLRPDPAACPRSSLWYTRYIPAYTWYIPGMTVHRLFQPPFLLAVALFALVIGTFSGSGMTKVQEDRFVCLACQARHFPAIFSSRRALRIHMHHSKNPKCALEWSKIRVMTRFYCRWIGGNGTLPSSATPATGC